MIAGFLHRLCRDRSQTLVRRCRQPFVKFQLKGIDENLTHDGSAEIAVRLLSQGRVQIFAMLPQEGELILVAAPTFDLSGVAQEKPGLADEVERQVGQSQVLFECRGVPHPFAQPLTEHQGEIAQAQHVAE